MRFAVFVAAVLAALPALGQPVPPDLDAAVRAEGEKFRTWSQDAKLLAAVREQNSQQVPLSRIRALDMDWVGQVEVNARMRALLANPCAKSLQTLTGSWPGYREAFAMDNQGALVCMTRKTTDYWQGDEDKWKKSFNDGRGAVFVGPPEEDESTHTTLVHVSVPIQDGGKTIGVLAVGVDRDLLRKRETKP